MIMLQMYLKYKNNKLELFGDYFLYNHAIIINKNCAKKANK